MGISTAVTAGAIAGVREEKDLLAFLVLSAFSALSVIFGLYAIHPPRFMRKKDQRESIFYNKKIIEHGSAKEYADVITRAITEKDAVINEYATEMYNLFRYYYLPKRFLFKISRNLLMVGVIISVVIYFFQRIY